MDFALRQQRTNLSPSLFLGPSHRTPRNGQDRQKAKKTFQDNTEASTVTFSLTVLRKDVPINNDFEQELRQQLGCASKPIWRKKTVQRKMLFRATNGLSLLNHSLAL